MTLIPPPDPARLDADVQRRLKSFPPLTILQILAHAPSIFEPTVSLGTAVLTDLELPRDLRLLVTLHVARELEAPYVQAQYLSAAAGHDVDPAKAQAVHDGRLPDAQLTEVEQVVLDVTGQVLRANAPSPHALAALRSLIPDRQVVELLVVIGYYTLICRITTSCRLAPHESLVTDLLDVIDRPGTGAR